jgi:hypothetical protein
MSAQTSDDQSAFRRGYRIGLTLFSQGCPSSWEDYYRLVYLSAEPLYRTEAQPSLIAGFNAGYRGEPLADETPTEFSGLEIDDAVLEAHSRQAHKYRVLDTET